MDSTSADLGLLVMRLSLGAMLIAHGLNKVVGAGGIRGTAAWFEAIGMRPGLLHARVAAATETGAGLLMILGLVQPLTSAAFIGLMTVAALTDHRGKGFFVFRGGWEYVALVGLIAAALAATGPGGISLDSRLGWIARGPGWMLGAGVLGIGLAGVTLLVARGAAPSKAESA